MSSLISARALTFVSALAVLGLGCTPPTPPPPPPPPPECTTDADCTGSITACQRHVCAASTCTVAQLPRGTRLETQTAGDCRASVCGDNGVVTVANDDTDLPVDGNECTSDLCTAGVPSHGFLAADTACGAAGALRCDGAGRCVTCNTAADCAQGSSCQSPSCVDGACGLTNLARGTRMGTQAAGDCKASQCDGNGATETVNDDADVPVDATTCTSDTCTNGVPSNPPVTTATACNEGDGLVCNGGACVQCVAATDCPGFDTECNVRTCTAGVCGRRFAANDTLLASQTASDCKKVVCDGQGRVVTRNDDADVPNDNNACTIDTCSAGVPSNANAASGATCGTAQVCNGTGGCVGCNTAADCPGTDSECSRRTCVANTCGVNNTAAGVALTTQTPNDCRRMVCNGTGAAVNQDDDADLPVDDGNQCTTQGCSNGTPTFPTRPLNSSCTQNGGSFCTAGGQCVACTAATQCPGTDTACQARTCVANACGLSFMQAGLVIASQTTGDCKQNECAGDGGIVVVNADADLPADDGNQCTSARCNNGVPGHQPTGRDSSCNQNGGTWCDGAGVCVQCNQSGQCPGTDSECAARTCSAGSCGWNYEPAGTATPTQATGDCREARCAGDGGFLSVNLDTDVPAEDGNQCTSQACSSGAPAFPAVTAGATCTQSGGSTGVCTGTTCVACIAPSDCPGADTECATRTCISNVCGVANTQSGTALTAQTANDCKTAVCDGAGGTTVVANAADLPVDDGIECTAEVCNGTSPGHPAKPVDTACGTNGTQFCTSLATCVQCNVPAQCGADGTCFTRTCSSGTCAVSNTADGTPVGTQVPGDCLVNVCDGAGNPESRASSTDAPSDDNQCTTDTCSGGAPLHTNATSGTACTQSSGRVCDGSGVCVGCLSASDCPATGTECSIATCSSNTCGTQNEAAGVAVTTQTAGDCRQLECDGNGAEVPVALDADLPIDNLQCTADVCTAGAATNPALSAGTACTEGGGDSCNGAGGCVVAPAITGVVPADNSSAPASTTVAITFSKAMSFASLTAQPAAGACTGTVQVSSDDFATCWGLGTAAPSGANTVATFTASIGFAINTTYKVKVTTGAKETSGAPLKTEFVMANGFLATPVITAPTPTVVISQVYGAGGNASATYKADFVELHNRGPSAVNVGGWSVQYASSAGSSWSMVSLPSGTTLNGGQFLLVKVSAEGAVGVSLVPDVNGTSITASASAAKFALVNTQTALTGTCPTGASLVDFVGYGSATNCSETAPVGTSGLTSAQSLVRKYDGCVDTGDNSRDFSIVSVAPRNASSPAVICGAAVNDGSALEEIDYCNVQSPSSISVAAGAAVPAIYARVYNAGTTEAAGASSSIQAQIGYGPANANPQWQSGWVWSSAAFNQQYGNDDEYMVTLTAPPVGSYLYGARFSFDGILWTYCDLNGAGSNGTLVFEPSQLAPLTVTP